MVFIDGGVCAAKGFQAAGVHCGVRRNKSKKDISLIFSDVPCAAAAVYTQNSVKGAPLIVTKENLSNGRAQAVICNSGNANTCSEGGVDLARRMCALVGEALSINPKDVIVASTGVIGQKLDIAPIAQGITALSKALSPEKGRDAAWGIMTTDTRVKEIAVEFALGGKTCRMGGIAKGSGMVHPNMATVLAFVTCDAAIAPRMLSEALSKQADSTFNMISVDGDTSTNDMAVVLSNGLAGNEEIAGPGADFDLFSKALNQVLLRLSRLIASDGDGATKLLECAVRGASDLETARAVAKSVIASPLVKTAMFGSDANWGRVMCAIGNAGRQVDVQKIDVDFASCVGRVAMCRGGVGVPFSEDDAKRVLRQDEVTIRVDLNDGAFEALAFGCDMTYDYIRMNGDYRSLGGGHTK